MTAAPRYSTPRSPRRANAGAAAQKLATVLGLDLMPWQREAVKLFTERANDRLVFSDATLLVPRQNGKSTLILVLLLLRALGVPGSKCFYAAQTLKDARSMLLETWVPLLDASALYGSYSVRSANGSEAIRFKNGSTIALVTSTSTKAGHGLVVDMAVVDEAFAQPDTRLETALLPAMATRTNVGGGPQFVVVSTAGTPAGSPYLLERVETGRQLAEARSKTGAAYVEYSADDDADPSDPATWAACNPALGHTITEEAIAAEFASLDLMDFKRSRLCQWTVRQHEPVIPLALWEELVDRRSQPGANLALAFDSAPDGAWSSIAAASVRDDGLLHVELLDRQPGTGWLAAEVKRLHDAHKPYVVVCDGRGAHVNALPELDRLGLAVRELGAADAATAHSSFVTACQEKALRHIDQAEVTAALTGAVRRPLGDAFAWSRRSSSVDISPLVAVTEAAWAARSLDPRGVGIFTEAQWLESKGITDRGAYAAELARERNRHHEEILAKARERREREWQQRVERGGPQ